MTMKRSMIYNLLAQGSVFVFGEIARLLKRKDPTDG